MAESRWSARTFGRLPKPWSLSRTWFGEWMTVHGETWFARIAPHGDPNTPPIVMLHGLVVSGSYFRPVATWLDHRYTIYIPDLPGHGKSVSRRTWDIPSLTVHLTAWMDAHHLSGSILVANSLGCQIATMLATKRPDLVRGMVLVGPTVDPKVRNAVHLVLRGALDLPRETQSLWLIWIPDLFRTGIRRALAMLRMTMADNQLDRLGRIQQPALLVAGEHDPIAPPEWVHEMARRMPNARALILPGRPHAMNYSSPRDLGRAIDTVIRGRIHEE